MVKERDALHKITFPALKNAATEVFLFSYPISPFYFFIFILFLLSSIHFIYFILSFSLFSFYFFFSIFILFILQKGGSFVPLDLRWGVVEGDFNHILVCLNEV